MLVVMVMVWLRLCLCLCLRGLRRLDLLRLLLRLGSGGGLGRHCDSLCWIHRQERREGGRIDDSRRGHLRWRGWQNGGMGCIRQLLCVRMRSRLRQSRRQLLVVMMKLGWLWLRLGRLRLRRGLGLGLSLRLSHGGRSGYDGRRSGRVRNYGPCAATHGRCHRGGGRGRMGALLSSALWRLIACPRSPPSLWGPMRNRVGPRR